MIPRDKMFVQPMLCVLPAAHTTGQKVVIDDTWGVLISAGSYNHFSGEHDADSTN